MNIDEMKTEWQQYGQRLAVTQRLNEQLLFSMLKERSRSRVAKIRRENMGYMVLMGIVLAVLAAILVGNPFDFIYTWQYIPFALLAVGVILAILVILRSFNSFTPDMNKIDLGNFLTRIIAGYERNKKAEQWFGIIMFSGGVLTVLSYLPKKLAHKPLWSALGETGVLMLIALLMYFVAFKLGAFKNGKQEGFENDLQELNELKSISAELGDQ